ncbi:MAG TPA: AAA family ATPase [Bacteroidales bacterium]|jgi:predicted ABC-type ATPase|nr:AAA family ATPase [Bacteroidales bacterium]HPY80341.1 zeta toxin family protein [Bacteroidales bacterium]
MRNMYILSGCNGAGKTTVAFSILPEMLQIKEFVNADEIAKGLSPFQPERATFQAGKIMIRRIKELIDQEIDFAIETTLSAGIYKRTILFAQQRGYTVTMIFFWLNSMELAKERVKRRVESGGHNVPENVIERRYQKGLFNFFNLYLPLCDHVQLFDNSEESPKLVMKKNKNSDEEIIDIEKYNEIKACNVIGNAKKK